MRGANDNNATWVIEAPTKRRFSLSPTAAVAPTRNAERLGQAIRYVQSELAQLNEQ